MAGYQGFEGDRRQQNGALQVAFAALCLALAACSTPPRRIDPIFGLETPLLFAHRGGAGEAPESTELAFAHALEVGVDVLELDVQLTSDGQFVIWHGPKLDNVHIQGQNNENPRKRPRRNINEYSWEELKNAWVADPCSCPECCPVRQTGSSSNSKEEILLRSMPCSCGGCSDLQHVPHRVPNDDKRKLLLLSTLLARHPCAPLNIELKDSVRVGDVHRFIQILDQAPSCESDERKILVVSQRCDLIDEVRAEAGERYATGEPAFWAIGKMTRCLLPLPVGNMRNRALQTSWLPPFSCRSLLNQVREAGGASHVFVTGFLGLDTHPCDVTESRIDGILRRGADGIMTNRPSEVKPILDRWKREHPLGQNTPPAASCHPPDARARPEKLKQFAMGLSERLSRHVRKLADVGDPAEDIGPRSWAAYEGLRKAKDYIRDELARAGYNVEPIKYTPTLSVGHGRAFFNLEATPKKDTHPRKEVVLIGAHYDTDATDKYGPTPGADDNASGVAALIELARYFSDKQFQRTIRFVAFTNEEEPFFSGRKEDMGSWQYARMAYNRGDNIAAMLSLETMGYYVQDKGSQRGVYLGRLFGLNLPDRGDFVALVANSGSADEVECARRGFQAYSDFPLEPVVLPGCIPGTKIDWSDHRSFWQHGYKGMMVTDTAPMRNKAYHKRWDTADSLNYPAMSRVVTGLVGAIEALAGPEQ